MTTTATRLLTADDLLRLHGEGVRGELIRGVLCETMPVGREHGEIVMALGTEIGKFVQERKLGRIAGSDVGVWLERDPDTVREPDIAFFSTERAPPGERVTGYAETAPDLVVEVASPSDRRTAVDDKARMWLAHGVRLVWVVHPDTRTVDVHRAGGPAATLADGDALDGGEVLPGFECGLDALFGAWESAARRGTAGVRLAAAAEEAAHAVPRPAAASPPEAFEEAAPRRLRRLRALQAAHAVVDDVAHAPLLAGVEPEAVLVAAGIEFEVVGAVVEGRHPLAAGGAIEVGIALGVADRAAALVLAGARRLQRVELVVVEPAAVAVRAVVDLDAVHALLDEVGAVPRALHRRSASRARRGCVAASVAAPRRPRPVARDAAGRCYDAAMTEREA